jgi:AcrR family transcriptional regulator
MKIDDDQAVQAPGARSEAGVSRMTREQSRANTRDRLLAAARSVFARSGFHGASVDEIAAEAGFSTGALYSNFDGRRTSSWC